MTDAGFFKGTSADQDSRFSDKNKKLMKTMKFADNIDRKIDMKKIRLELMRPHIEAILQSLIPVEDDVMVEYVFSQLEEKQHPDGKLIQIMMTGFLGKTKARQFMSELWDTLCEAQASKHGVPAVLMEKKREELIKKKEEDTKISASLNKNKEEIERCLNIRDRQPLHQRNEISHQQVSIQKPPRSPPKVVKDSVDRNRREVRRDRTRSRSRSPKYKSRRNRSRDRSRDRSRERSRDRSPREKSKEKKSSRRFKEKTPPPEEKLIVEAIKLEDMIIKESMVEVKGEKVETSSESGSSEDSESSSESSSGSESGSDSGSGSGSESGSSSEDEEEDGRKRKSGVIETSPIEAKNVKVVKMDETVTAEVGLKEEAPLQRILQAEKRREGANGERRDEERRRRDEERRRRDEDDRRREEKRREDRRRRDEEDRRRYEEERRRYEEEKRKRDEEDRRREEKRREERKRREEEEKKARARYDAEKEEKLQRRKESRPDSDSDSDTKHKKRSSHKKKKSSRDDNDRHRHRSSKKSKKSKKSSGGKSSADEDSASNDEEVKIKDNEAIERALREKALESLASKRERDSMSS